MRKSLITAAIAFAVIAAVSLAVLPPEAYEELREDAPVVVTGEVLSDGDVKKVAYGKLRQFEIKIDGVERGELEVGDVIKVEYFVRSEPLDGPGGIRGVTVGDEYKLWLKPTDEDGVYEGAAYGSSLETIE